MASSTKAGLWLKIASLNVNGLNDVSKQIKLVTYLNEKSVNIAMIQEHNVKSLDKLEYILKYYTVILNKSILFKGGIIILIEKKCKLLWEEHICTKHHVYVQVQYTLFKTNYSVHNVCMDPYMKYMLLSELLRARLLYSKQYYGVRS